jgi:hypothetical protein
MPLRLLLTVLGLLVLGLGSAEAGTGHVLYWGSYPQLVLGSFFLALLETFAVRKRYGAHVNSWLVLAANFFSLLIGFVVIVTWFTHLAGLDFWGLASESGWEYRLALLLGLVVGFVFSVLIEWPFYYAALRLLGKHQSYTALHVTIFAQFVSFALIVVYAVVVLLVRG